MSIKILSIAVLVVALSYANAGTLTQGEVCSVTSDCNTDLELSCVITYDQCTKGRCQCAAGKTSVSNAKCAVPAATTPPTTTWIGESCSGSGPFSAPNAVCTSSVVACPASGYTKHGTTVCIKDDNTEALLGAGCTSGTTTCYGYTERGVIQTSTGGILECADVAGSLTCKCISTYKTSGTSCVLKEVGDSCSADADCIVSTFKECTNSKCACITGTTAVSGQCAIAGTVAAGGVCVSGQTYNSFNTANTCSTDLLCGQCPGESNYQCLKESSGSAGMPSLFLLLSAAVIGLFGRAMV